VSIPTTPAADETPGTPPLDRVRGIWTRRRWLALIVFTAPFTAIVSLVTALPNVYQSTAKILVESQQVPEAFVRSTVTSDINSRLQTIGQEVQSRARLEEIINRFGLYADLRRRMPIEEVIERMRGDIKVDVDKGEGAAAHTLREMARRGSVTALSFGVTYRGGDPETVALIANTLAAAYIEENLKVRERQASGTAQFLRAQLEETKQRLDEQEKRISEFKKRHVGELPEQQQANLATLERLNTQARINGDNQARAFERRQSLLKQLADAGATGVAGAPDAAVTRLATLRQNLVELRGRFSDRYPDVIRLKAEIASLQQELTAPKPETKAGPDTMAVSPSVMRLRLQLDDVEAELKILKNEEKQVRASIAGYQARVENAPRREQELQELSRGYEATKILYRSLETRHDEAQLAESMEQRQKGEQFRIVDSALPAGSPAAPKRGQLYGMALIVCLVLAGAAALVAEQLDGSFHTVDELRAFTSVPVLLTLPRIVTEQMRARRQQSARVTMAALAAGVLVIVVAAYLVGSGNEQLVGMLLPKKF
jgi:polysaccharide chain length determinant protein (PEP-CTERM system associated)